MLVGGDSSLKEKGEVTVQKRGDDSWNKVLKGIEKGERHRMEATHTWQNHKTGAWVPEDSRDALSALDNYLQTLCGKEINF